MTPEDHAKLINIIERHQRMIELISIALADHACMMKPLLIKCPCGEPLTMFHAEHGSFCDSCAARNIVEGKSLENEWIDNDDATRVRHLVEYVSMIEQFEAYSPATIAITKH